LEGRSSFVFRAKVAEKRGLDLKLTDLKGTNIATLRKIGV
jgi:hypothetical protein